MGWGAQFGCFEAWGCSSEKFIPIAAPSMSEAVALEKMNGDDRNICEVKIDECENSDSSCCDEVANLWVTIVLTMARAGLVKSVRGVPGALGTVTRCATTSRSTRTRQT
jgi:hypothetical protein